LARINIFKSFLRKPNKTKFPCQLFLFISICTEFIGKLSIHDEKLPWDFIRVDELNKKKEKSFDIVDQILTTVSDPLRYKKNK